MDCKMQRGLLKYLDTLGLPIADGVRLHAANVKFVNKWLAESCRSGPDWKFLCGHRWDIKERKSGQGRNEVAAGRIWQGRRHS